MRLRRLLQMENIVWPIRRMAYLSSINHSDKSQSFPRNTHDRLSLHGTSIRREADPIWLLRLSRTTDLIL